MRGLGGVQVFHGGDEIFKGLGEAGCPPVDHPGDGGLAHAEGFDEFCLGAVAAVVDEGGPDFFGLAHCRRASGFLQGARVIVGRDLVESCHCGHGETCCMLPVGACPEIIEYLATQLSLW